MKKIIALLLILTTTLFSFGCTKGDTGNEEDQGNGQEKIESEEIEPEEQKRIDLYVAALKAAFNEENGGKDFVAVKLDTLDGLSDKGKKRVLEDLKDLSDNVYSFEEVKDDKTKFKYDEKGRMERTLDGSLLYLELVDYKGNKAKIRSTSWFGNLGAVFPKYKATYKNGKWNLKLIEIAVS